MTSTSAPAAGSKSQRTVRIESTKSTGRNYHQILRTLARRVLETQGWKFDIDVIIADDVELRRLHRTFFADDSTTDVMAFPADESTETPGEIYLNLEEARRQAAEVGESLQRALSRLLIHGILHLGGWRDRTNAQRKRMLQYGERLLSDLVDPA